MKVLIDKHFQPVAFILILLSPRSHLGSEELVQSILFPTLAGKVEVLHENN